MKKMFDMYHATRSHLTCKEKKGVAILVAFLIFCSSYAQTKFRKTASMFDGKTLSGWTVVNERDSSLWSVENGAINCNHGGKMITANSFLRSDKEYKNYEFRCLFRLSGDSGFINSGIQYRSFVNAEGNVVGYQADIGNG